MKVLMVTPSYYPIIGGSETAVETITKKLNEHKVKADILTFNMDSKWNTKWNEEIEENSLFKIYREPAISLSKLCINPLKIFRMHVIPKPSFLKILKNYDIVHFQGEADLGLAIFSTLLNKPKVFQSHGAGEFLKDMSFKGKIILDSTKKIFPHLADIYMGVSEESLHGYGVPKSKIKYLPFGIDVDKFKPDEEKLIYNLIVFVGRIYAEKGLHVLLNSLSKINIKAKLVIIGPKGDKVYADKCFQLVKKITENGLHEIDYLGSMPVDEIIPWYQKAAVLVRPDLTGISGGITSLESLSCGTPVIGTGNHVIKNGVNGIIVPPNNPQKLGEALELLLKNKKVRQKYGEEGRRLVQKKYSLESIVIKLIEVYKALLNDNLEHSSMM